MTESTEEEITSADSLIWRQERPLPQLLNIRCCGVTITHLDLSHSELSSIPSHVFAIKNLRTFDASHNQIRFIDSDIPRLSSLETISLDFNQLIVDKRTLESMGQAFPNLVRLSVACQEEDGRNKMISVIEISEQLFPRLLYLNASGNEMRSIRKIRGNHLIEKLVLHSNGLRELPSLIGCEKLTVLDISNNCLLGAGNFSHLLTQSPFLRSIDFSGNSSCFHFNELPINSTHKPLDLVKVEPHSDLCRLSFSNTLYDRINESCVCICSQPGERNQLFACLFFGTSFPASFRKDLPGILQHEMHVDPKDFLRNALERVCRTLSISTSVPTTAARDFNAILCHLTMTDLTTSASIDFACCGNDVSIRLLQDDDSLLVENVTVSDILSESNRLRKQVHDSSSLIPVTGRVELVQRSSVCLLGIKVREDTRSFRDPCHLFFTDSSLSTNLRKYSEYVKFLPGEGHMVMAIQPNLEAPSVSDVAEYSEKFRSWDYILEENDKIEKLEEKIVPIVKRNSVMMTEYTLSALKVQRDYKSLDEKTANSYLQLHTVFKI